MPNARQTSLIASPSSSQATNRRRSSITEHSFHGIHASPGKGKVLPMCPVRSVTYVSGRSYLSRDFIFVGQEPPLSARVCRAAFPAQSAETRGGPPTCANPRKYLSQAIFQYRISGDAVATSCRAKASRVPPNEIGLPLGSGMLVDLARSGGSSEAEHGPLIVPTERQTGVL